MNLIEAKVTAMISLGLGSLSMGLLPVLFTRFSRNKYPLFLSTLLCFGAGVLLATSMVHLLPEVRESLAKYSQYAEVIFCGGFFILYCIDEIVHFCKSGEHHHGHNSNEIRPILRNSRRHSTGGVYGATKIETGLLHQPPYNPNYRNSENNLLGEPTPSTSSSHSCGQELRQFNPSQICHIGHQEPCQRPNTASISLIIALTVHAILEGLAVGLEDSTSQVLLMLAAIASHKLVVGFCLGAELSSSEETTACKYFTSISMFSFGSVLGIGLGLGVTDLNKRLPQLVAPILQGLAGGTLLYVTVSEVLPRERAQWHQVDNKKTAGIVQFIAVSIGFAAMSILAKCLPA